MHLPSVRTCAAPRPGTRCAPITPLRNECVNSFSARNTPPLEVPYQLFQKVPPAVVPTDADCCVKFSVRESREVAMGAGASSIPGEDNRGVSNEVWAKLDRKGAGALSVADLHDAMVELARDDPQIAELDKHVRGLLLKAAAASEPATLTSGSLYDLMAKEGPPTGMVDADEFYDMMQKIYSPPTPVSATSAAAPPSPAAADAGGEAPPPPAAADAPAAPPLDPSRLDINAMYSTLSKGARGGGGEAAAKATAAKAKAKAAKATKAALELAPMALPLPPMMMTAEAAVASRPAADLMASRPAEGVDDERALQAPASRGSNNQTDRLSEAKLGDAEAKAADDFSSGGSGGGGSGGGSGGGGSGGGGGLASSLSDFRGFDFELDGLEEGGDEEKTLPSLLSINLVLRHVLSFLPWSQRGADLLTVSTDFLGDAPHESGDAVYWYFMCQQLSEGAGVYFAAEAAADLADQRGSMRNLFLELWPLRRVFAPPGLFSEPPEAAEAPPIRLQAMIRFRPGKHGPVVDTTNMALPFHQRLNILKVS